MSNFSVPVPTSPFVNIKTGLVDRQWYQFLTNIFSAQGGGAVGTTTQVLHGNNGGYTSVFGADIAANTVANVNLAQMPASTFKANSTVTSATPADITPAQALTLLGIGGINTPVAWTPADNSGAALAFSAVSASSTTIGNIVFVYATLTYPATLDPSGASITGFPVTVANQNYAQVPAIVDNNASLAISITPTKGTKNALFLFTGTGVQVTNAQLTGAALTFILPYPVA